MRSATRDDRRTTPDSNERGFAIIGVVMLVLALTILGLSLFSLSSYESQFINRSLNEQRAFDAATRGIERAKFQILNKGDLDRSGWGRIPFDGVDSVQAWQVIAGTTYTTGIVNGGAPVFLRAYGHVKDAISTVEGQFQPKSSADYYRRLFTISNAITTGDPIPDPLRNGTVHLSGNVWQNNGPWGWQGEVSWTNPPDSLRQGGSVPLPPVSGPSGFIAAHMTPTPTYIAKNPGGGNPVYVLNAPGPDPKFFTSDPSLSSIVGFTLAELAGSPTIQVYGAAVWLLPQGVHFFSKVTVTPYNGGGANNCLIIVAGPATALDPYLNRGIQFESGLDSSIPVFLVTDSRCMLHQIPNFSTTTNYISVYARDLNLEGPRAASGTVFALRHPKTSPNDSPNGLIDWLVQKGALPNGSMSRPELSMIPGTWKLTSN